MVPIRAIVEAMDGTVGWEGTAQKITLSARGNVVELIGLIAHEKLSSYTKIN